MGVSVEAAVRLGRGEPLVLLHDLGLTWHSWGRCVEALARRYEVWAPTLPGHWGGPAFVGAVTPTTMADLVEGQLDEAGLTRVHLAGNGFGAWIAAELADRGRAESLSLIAPLGLWRDDPVTSESVRTELSRRASVSSFLAHVRHPVLGPITRRAAMRTLTGRSAPALLELCAATDHRASITAEAPSHCAILGEMVRSREFALGWYPRIDASSAITVLTGEWDNLVHRPARELVPDGIVRAHHVLEHGHVPMLDDPDTITAHIHTRISGPYVRLR
ncbi:alpha/beta fold hydrolase [Nocardia sp. NPDC058176]|uniref:alpha/beta fold hydrolase n=1 Tax=Nocardia sp. NPDC058176 TaxID=3346368 RepID=UPI0036DE4442